MIGFDNYYYRTMKQSIYHRIPDIATDDLIELQQLFIGLHEDHPTPRRHDYRGTCIYRISLELEKRARLHGAPPPSTIRSRVT